MSLKPSARTEARRNQYKVTVDAEEGRRRREDNMVEVRKIKREESLMKKRREALDDFSGLVDDDMKLESLQDMVAGVWSENPDWQLNSTTQIRKLLSIRRSPPIDKVIGSGVVPRLVEFLKKEDNHKIQLEAAWALTNIASGTSDHTKVVIEHNAVPIFVQLLASPNDDVREQAVWGLGNVAGDSKQCRDYVLNCGALVPLLNQLNEHTKLSMLREVTWTLSNLCRGGGLINPEALQALERLIHSTDEQVLTDACWALSYITRVSNDKIQAVIDSGFVPRLVELLLHPCMSVLVPALRTVGNIVTGDALQTQFVINSGALPCLAVILTQNYKRSIKKETCWTISNITAGTKEQIQAVLEANLIAPLVKLLQCAEFDIKKEAAWAISYVAFGGSHDQIKYLVEQGCIKPLCNLLRCVDPKIIILCLKALENILKVGEEEKNLGNTGDMNHYAELIDDAGGLDKMEDLQNHDNSEIYDKALRIMETYWLEEDEETQQSPDGFNFN
ncbi:PREDICTED: importin subunit alpha-1-like [Camelina sativa]|uniref:Importin subunit alpha n=1 Tax=Camelina sativa TaxID=90675 RepID=A0ABM0Y4H9_CAMSA|nr:PREDICTED: importin subunit alpha-1-like [Camelina sativa]